MPSRIQIILEDGEIDAVLDDSPTAEAVRAVLPLEGTVSRWGDEIYFTIPVKVDEAPDARQDMAVGELGYWPMGAAFCIFWGPTPASSGTPAASLQQREPFRKDRQPHGHRQNLALRRAGWSADTRYALRRDWGMRPPPPRTGRPHSRPSSAGWSPLTRPATTRALVRSPGRRRSTMVSGHTRRRPSLLNARG